MLFKSARVRYKGGCCHGNTKYVKEGAVLCWPGEKLRVMRTHLRTIDLRCDRVQSTTRQGDLVTFITETSLTAVIPKNNELYLKKACELFLDKSDADIDEVIREETEGCHKGLAAAMLANDIVQNRHGFNRGLTEMLSGALDKYGIMLEKVMLTHIKFPSDEILNAVCNDVKIGEGAPEDTRVTFY